MPGSVNAQGVYEYANDDDASVLSVLLNKQSAALNAALGSRVHIQRVPDVSGRTAYTSGKTVTAADPLLVWRADAPDGSNLEYTIDGANWRTMFATPRLDNLADVEITSDFTSEDAVSIGAGANATRMCYYSGKLYVACTDTDQIKVIDVATGTVTATWTCGDAPVEIAILQIYVDYTGTYLTVLATTHPSINRTEFRNPSTGSTSIPFPSGPSVVGVFLWPDFGSPRHLPRNASARGWIMDSTQQLITHITGTRILAGGGLYFYQWWPTTVDVGASLVPGGLGRHITIGNDAYVLLPYTNYIFKIKPDGTYISQELLGVSPFDIVPAINQTLLYVSFDDGSVSKVGTTYLADMARVSSVGGGELVLSPDNSTLYVCDPTTNVVHLVDTATMTAIDTITVGGSSTGVSSPVISPDGEEMFVVTSATDQIHRLSLTTLTTLQSINVGDNPIQVIVPNNDVVEVLNSDDDEVQRIVADPPSNGDVLMFTDGKWRNT